MPAFTFRMATLLRLREAARDLRRAELAEAHRVEEVVLRQQQQLAAEIDGVRQQQRRLAGPGVVNVDQLMESQRYELSLRAHEKQLARQREAIAAEIQRRREALVEATREVRTLELLRERQWETYQQDENRRDIKRLDEVAQQRAARAEVV